MIPTLAVMKRVAAVLPGARGARLRDGVGVGYEMAPFVPPTRIALRTGLWPRLTILAWPDRPSRYQALFKLCAVNGYRITTRPEEPHDLFWYSCYHLDQHPAAPPEPGVNVRCRDVSKRRVGQVFEEVFGYSLTVDPTQHRGLLVEKADTNHSFEGRIVEAPMRPENVRADRVYQRFIDTTEAGQALDLRVPIYGGTIPVVYEKRRPIDADLKDVRTARMAAPEAIFTDDERAGLLRFADAMGLDYAEIDVLRDRGDGRIYVVDANNTPAGPPKQMSRAEIAQALTLLSPAFTALVEAAREARGRPPA
ncbi:MAG: hypothetical protein ACFE0R_10340 [Salinarimonas sp.]